MFEELSGKDWLFVLGALVLGFGIVKFLLSNPAVESLTAGATDSRPLKVSCTDSTSEDSRSQQAQRSWWEILDIDAAASVEEIRAAFQRKRAQYHPDKIAGLGEDFLALSTRKTQEIDQAYKQALLEKGQAPGV